MRYAYFKTNTDIAALLKEPALIIGQDAGVNIWQVLVGEKPQVSYYDLSAARKATLGKTAFADLPASVKTADNKPIHRFAVSDGGESEE